MDRGSGLVVPAASSERGVCGAAVTDLHSAQRGRVRWESGGEGQVMDYDCHPEKLTQLAAASSAGWTLYACGVEKGSTMVSLSPRLILLGKTDAFA